MSASLRLAEFVFGLRRRASRLRHREERAGRFSIPMLDGGPSEGKTPVVLLHGFSDTKDSFVDVARHLTRTHRVILPDLPGFSDASQPVDHHYTVASITAVLRQALDELRLDAVHLVGNSLGGAVAAQLTLDDPGWVRSLTLIGAAGVPMPVPSAFQRHIAVGHNPFVIRSREEYLPFMRFVVERIPPGTSLVLPLMAERFLARRAMNEKILDELVDDDLDLRERLSEITVPTLLLWGDRDRIIDLSAAREYQRVIAGSRLVVLHQIGHCPQVEAPRTTALRILETMAIAEEGSR